MGLKNWWFFTSDAPARDPSLRISSLMSNFRITDLQRLLLISPVNMKLDPSKTYLEAGVELECSGKGTSSRKMFAKVALRFFPLNGVVPNSIS